MRTSVLCATYATVALSFVNPRLRALVRLHAHVYANHHHRHHHDAGQNSEEPSRHAVAHSFHFSLVESSCNSVHSPNLHVDRVDKRTDRQAGRLPQSEEKEKEKEMVVHH